MQIRVRRAVSGDEPILRALHLEAMAMWVHPELRATGAADALVASVLAWAAEEGAREVRLQVVKGNDRAERCYQRNGFRRTGCETVREERGIVEVEMARAVSA